MKPLICKLNGTICAVIYGILLLPGLLSCNDLIEYSPYDTDISSKNQNTVFSNTLLSMGAAVGDSFTFALLSDTHSQYDEIQQAVKIINQQKKADFVVICGDVTEGGLAKEFQFYWDQISKLEMPFITVIGNHDYLSNGKVTYQRLFGSTNFYFDYGNWKLIFFDDVVWEKGNVSPDFNWLSQVIEASDKRCIVMTHIPPWAEQFTPEYTNSYCNIVSQPEVALSIHGHLHAYKDTLIQQKRYFVSACIRKKEFYYFDIKGNQIGVDRIFF